LPGYIEDRWYTKRPDPETGKRRKTARYGQGKRWRVAGIPGVRGRSFTNLEGPGGAKAWLKASATDTTRGAYYDPRDGQMTLREYVEQHWWPHLRKPPTTRQSMKSRVFKHILPHVGHLPLNRIGHDEIRAWQTAAEKNIDVGTLSVTWAHFSSIMQAAHKAKRIPVNPFRDDDLKAPRTSASKAKAWPLPTFTAVRGELSPRYQVLADLGAGAGLRQGECFGFSPDDIDGDAIHVTRQIVVVRGRMGFAPPKGGKERDAPCFPELAQAVKLHAEQWPSVEVTLPWVDPRRPSLAWEDRPTRTVRLLVTTQHTSGINGGAINRTTFDDRQWKPSLVRAGVLPEPERIKVQGKGAKPWTQVKWNMPREDGFHVLRHTFASVVLAEGETITQLAAWLGHSDPAFTLRTYVHFMPSSGRRGIEALGRMLSAGGLPGSPAPHSPQILPEA
jgi:integrase